MAAIPRETVTACFNGDVAALSAWLSGGGSIDAKFTESGRTALMLACAFGHGELRGNSNTTPPRGRAHLLTHTRTHQAR